MSIALNVLLMFQQPFLLQLVHLTLVRSTVEISTQSGCSLLIENYYCATKSDIISKYFFSLKKSDTQNHSVLLIGDFSAPNFHWLSVFPYQSVILFTIKVDTIYTSTRPFGLTQYLPTDPVSAIPIL